MAQLKCIQKNCGMDAQYIDVGSSYCETHYREREEEQGTLSVRWLYFSGLAVWVVAWFWIFGWILWGWIGPQWLAEQVRKLYSGSEWLLLIPGLIGLVALVANLCLWWRPRGYARYETEVEVIEFVERNASWFLVASGAFLTAAAFFLTRPPGAKEAGMLPLPEFAREGLFTVLAFELVSLSFLFLVVLLYWIPPDPKKLALLRHIKTVPFIYGVSFFAAAFTALVRAAMS